MLSPNSPFLNIPAALVKRQAIFLDGLRQSGQIAIYAYGRLCESLSCLAFSRLNTPTSNTDLTGIFLDAWAFVDAVDRFRSLWLLQPAAETIPENFNPSIINKKLQSIRDLRNVSAHISQKIDQISALNSSVSGTLKWVTAINQEPLSVNTYFIRPGIVHEKLEESFLIPKDGALFTNHTACVTLLAGKHQADLSKSYELLCSIIEFAEVHLSVKFTGKEFELRLPADVIGSAQLDI